ncbi:hypothetical protein PIIN_08894 [Serendipita indica DSM 11827]|uniref:Uncharacterized protein n=1 Tax=Serendipita indica (strain DSM 11827) TaxID=1109443 RepID=G4TUD1_SERID|nr:hypothetical protein PIIN_08894 [Serendipita indica DSM 11827]
MPAGSLSTLACPPPLPPFPVDLNHFAYLMMQDCLWEVERRPASIRAGLAFGNLARKEKSEERPEDPESLVNSSEPQPLVRRSSDPYIGYKLLYSNPWTKIVGLDDFGSFVTPKNDELIETSSLAVSTWDTTVRPSDVLADTTNYTDPSSVHNLGHSQAFFPASLPASTLKPATLFEHPRSADVASLSSTDSPSHSQPNSLDSSVLDGPRIRTRKAPTPRYIPRYIPRPRSVLQNFRSPVTAQPSVRVLVWTKLPTDSKARPGVWHFKPAYSDQGTCIVPSSNGHLLDVLASLGSRDGRQIAWFDYGTGAWNYQDVDTPIHIEHDRPILLCNYRVAHQLSVNWAIVGELTGYKYRSFEPPQPYRVCCKRSKSLN